MDSVLLEMSRMYVEANKELEKSDYLRAEKIIDRAIKRLQNTLPQMYDEKSVKFAIDDAARHLDWLREKFRETKKEEMDDSKKKFISFINEKQILLIALLIRHAYDLDELSKLDMLIRPIFYSELVPRPDMVFIHSAMDDDYYLNVFKKRFESFVGKYPDFNPEIIKYKEHIDKKGREFGKKIKLI
ncbi:MAG: hypothetical protein ABID38_04725 [Candidatus Diapherotrites archaeon]